MYKYIYVDEVFSYIKKKKKYSISYVQFSKYKFVALVLILFSILINSTILWELWINFKFLGSNIELLGFKDDLN